jgi:hypothetical protein
MRITVPISFFVGQFMCPALLTRHLKCHLPLNLYHGRSTATVSKALRLVGQGWFICDWFLDDWFFDRRLQGRNSKQAQYSYHSTNSDAGDSAWR